MDSDQCRGTASSLERFQDFMCQGSRSLARQGLKTCNRVEPGRSTYSRDIFVALSFVICWQVAFAPLICAFAFVYYTTILLICAPNVCPGGRTRMLDEFSDDPCTQPDSFIQPVRRGGTNGTCPVFMVRSFSAEPTCDVTSIHSISSAI